MSCFIVQKDGSKTPAPFKLLRSLVESGRLAPETLVELDGEVKSASEIPEFADAYALRGVVLTPVVDVPPQVGQESSTEPPTESTSSDSLDVSSGADVKSAAELLNAESIRRTTALKINQRFFLARAFGFLLIGVGIFAPLTNYFSASMRRTFSDNVGGLSSRLGADNLNILLGFCLVSCLVVIFYWGVYFALRSAVLLHEETHARHEATLSKLLELSRSKEDPEEENQ